ncbi:MAG: cell division protein FtsW [Planctomycetota bacterium]|jgi:cell division protein FtsW
MSPLRRKYDVPLLIITGLLAVVGFFVFLSATFSIFPSDKELFIHIVLRQAILGLGGGVLAGYFCYKIPARIWQKYALPLFLVSLGVTALVFIPSLAQTHGGATRWISLGFLSFQPAEFLKVGAIIYMAAWYTYAGEKVSTIRYGLIPLLLILGATGALLLAQPDTGTFLVIAMSITALYFLSNAKWKHLGILFILGLLAFIMLLIARPYVFDRFQTFLNPDHDPLGSSYQIRQSLIALGSGQLFGRGYGQSVQKFGYLPEPTGDSIFAVAGEELGFIGSTTIVFLYILFALRGFWLTKHITNRFARLLVTGLVILILVQAFTNIASIMNIIPLTGLPLPFMSHGGTALLMSLATTGIILGLSSNYKR